MIQNKIQVILYSLTHTNLPVDITILYDPGGGSLDTATRPLVSILTGEDVEDGLGLFSCLKKERKKTEKKGLLYKVIKKMDITGPQMI